MSKSAPKSTMKWLQHLADQNVLIEVRSIHLGGAVTRFILTADAEEAWEWAEDNSDVGKLVTVNINQRDTSAEGITTNSKIEVINHLVFDFDPVRPRGMNASNIEVEAAFRAADHCRDAMRSMGWSEPAMAFTGSGWHLIYRVHFLKPADSSEYSLLRSLYKHMADHFATPTVSFDKTVKNPGRVVRLYGLPNLKCLSAPDRPQRDTWIAMPDVFEITDVSIITSTVAKLMPANVIPFPKAKVRPSQGHSNRGFKDIRTFDIVAWAASHGLYRHHVEGNKHSIVCPWEADHGSQREHGNGTIIFESQGGSWPGIFCHHASCDGRGIKDLMRDFPDWKDFAQVEGRAHG